MYCICIELCASVLCAHNDFHAVCKYVVCNLLAGEEGGEGVNMCGPNSRKPARSSFLTRRTETNCRRDVPMGCTRPLPVALYECVLEALTN